MVRCFVGLLLGIAVFPDADACVNGGCENQNRILDCDEQYKNGLRELSELRKKFACLNEKVNLYKESLKNMERTGRFGVSPGLFSNKYIKKHLFGIKDDVKSENDSLKMQHKTLANQIENVEKEYAVLKEIVAEKPTVKKEIYDKMVFQIEEKLNDEIRHEQILKMEYLLEVDSNKRLFVPFSMSVQDMELLSKENERLNELLQQKRLYLENIQSRNNYLRGEIYRLENGLFEFK